jgi:hypothetical protein
MKITATTNVDVELTDAQVLKITLDRLGAEFNWKPAYFIDVAGKKVMTTVTRYSSHSWVETVEVREATPDDFIAFGVFKKLMS